MGAGFVEDVPPWKRQNPRLQDRRRDGSSPLSIICTTQRQPAGIAAKNVRSSAPTGSCGELAASSISHAPGRDERYLQTQRQVAILESLARSRALCLLNRDFTTEDLSLAGSRMSPIPEPARAGCKSCSPSTHSSCPRPAGLNQFSPKFDVERIPLRLALWELTARVVRVVAGEWTQLLKAYAVKIPR